MFVFCFFQLFFQLFQARSKSGPCQSLLARSRNLILSWTPCSQWNYLVNGPLCFSYLFNSMYFSCYRVWSKMNRTEHCGFIYVYPRPVLYPSGFMVLKGVSCSLIVMTFLALLLFVAQKSCFQSGEVSLSLRRHCVQRPWQVRCERMPPAGFCVEPPKQRASLLRCPPFESPTGLWGVWRGGDGVGKWRSGAQ